MIPTNFEYVRAKSVQDAVALLTKHGEDAKLLAGGHSLIPGMKLRLNTPATLIDVTGIKELTEIRKEGDRIQIGALVTHRTIENSDVVQSNCRVLSDAAGQIGDPQVRNRGTIGGSLAHADPAADYPALILALDAMIQIEGPTGSRTLAADDFFTGLFETALNPDDMITKVSFPVLGEGTGAAYEKFAHPASRFAVVGVAAVVTIDDNGKCTAARIGVTGAGPLPFRATSVEDALLETTLDQQSISDATKQVADPADLLGDIFASADYRAHLCSVLSKRALSRARDRSS